MAVSKLKLRAVRKWLLRALVACFYGVAFRTRRDGAASGCTRPKRILLLNGAHIGDVVIATSLIPILRSAFPSAEIGFLCGSWSSMVVKNHPDLAYTHCVDHWRLNRGEISRWRKVLQFARTRSAALKEIRKLQYDVAISLHSVFSDMLDLGWTAKIPVRIGFRHSIFAALATDLVDEPESPFVHRGSQMAETLLVLPIQPSHFQLRHATLPPSDAASLQEVCLLLQASRLEDCRYRIVHMGAGAAYKVMPISFWRELAEELSPKCTLVFTGYGKQEEENITAAIYGLANCINACNRLRWDGFVAAVRHAEVLYGVDSMAGHVAGAVGTSCVMVYAGAAGVARWRPEGRDSIVFTNHVFCAPCYLPQGCSEMACMQTISPGELVSIIQLPSSHACRSPIQIVQSIRQE
jgi:ADP-heptose:LPS heptosyltransferase